MKLENAMKIGEVARLLGLAPQSVRGGHDIYLKPEIIMGQRYYDRATVEEYARKRAAKKAG